MFRSAAMVATATCQTAAEVMPGRRVRQVNQELGSLLLGCGTVFPVLVKARVAHRVKQVCPAQARWLLGCSQHPAIWGRAVVQAHPASLVKGEAEVAEQKVG